MPSRKPPSERPNRIFELTKARKWTYAEVARRVRDRAIASGDDAHSKVHTITINRLATGDANLTQDWMNILGDVFGIAPTELISAPIAENLRRVRVVYAFEAGKWRKHADMPTADQYVIAIPDEERLRGNNVYAGELRGQDVNLRYPPGSIVIVSLIEPHARHLPGEIAVGKRYHVRATRPDGMIEDTIKCLVEKEGRLWLKPESDHPAHQEWWPIEGRVGLHVELVGRVRGAFYPED